MKQFLLSLLCFVFINVNYGQTIIEVKNDSDTNRVFTKVDVEAVFPGGEGKWRHFLKLSFNDLLAADNGAPKGTYVVIVKFLVSKDGSLSDIVCESDPGYGMCREAIRLIRLSRKWIPAKVNGRVVNAYHRQAFTFLPYNE